MDHYFGYYEEMEAYEGWEEIQEELRAEDFKETLNQ